MTGDKCTTNQKEVISAGLRNEGTTSELCRRYGISHSAFDKCRRLFAVCPELTVEGAKEGERNWARAPASLRRR